VKVAISSDHAGFEIKEYVKQLLRERGYEILDFGGDVEEPGDDYPDRAYPAAKAVRDGEAAFGVLVCGTGIGIAMAANKVRGIRAAPCRTPGEAALARQHNNANILCLRGRPPDREQTLAILEQWLSASFQGGRHARRIAKIRDIEIAEGGARG